MNTQTICILFSILLVPVNLLCTHWMTQEAVHLTGMTYEEFLKTTSGISPASVRRKRNWWYYVNFFKEHSTDPEKSIRFMWMQVAAALSGGGKMFTIVADGVYYLVLFRGDTLIYACSPDSLTEINEILAETGYLRR